MLGSVAQIILKAFQLQVTKKFGKKTSRREEGAILSYPQTKW